MSEKRRYEDVLAKGSLLRIYVQELKQNVASVYEASLAHRNPYIRSKVAKHNLQAVVDSVQHCQDTIFLYMAALAKAQICTKQKLDAYFFVYQFLFEFQDDIKKQEWLHLLMMKNSRCIEKMEIFIAYTNEFIDEQEFRIHNANNLI